MDQDIVAEFIEALEQLDRLRVGRIVSEGLATRTPLQLVEQVVIPALTAIGQAWHDGSASLSQVYMSGRICEEWIEHILPPDEREQKKQPRSAIVVLNDYHMLGKRIVYSMLRASGFATADYGRLDVAGVVRRARDDRIEVLLISALMLPSALQVREVRQALGDSVKIAVGGAPFLFDENLWREVGADAMGRHAADAVQILCDWT